jgi:putative transposase
VDTKKKEICELLETRRAEIEAGELVIFMVDECHLLWGDICGYVWGKLIASTFFTNYQE